MLIGRKHYEEEDGGNGLKCARRKLQSLKEQYCNKDVKGEEQYVRERL